MIVSNTEFVANVIDKRYRYFLIVVAAALAFIVALACAPVASASNDSYPVSKSMQTQLAQSMLLANAKTPLEL